MLLRTASVSARKQHEPSTILRISNVTGYCILILVNVLAGTGVFGPTNAEISGRYPTPLTPEGWAFSIWGLIFTLQGCGVAYQALPHGYSDPEGWKRLAVNTIGYNWQIGWWLECAWQFSFLRQSRAAMWLCAALLLGAAAAFGRTLLLLYQLTSTQQLRGGPAVTLLFLVPTSVNTAWLTVASSIGLLVVPVAHGASQAALRPFAVVLAAALTALGAVVLWYRRDPAYGLTLIWAFVAVYDESKHGPVVRYPVLACIIVLGVFTMFSFSKRRDSGAGGGAAAAGGLLSGSGPSGSAAAGGGSGASPLMVKHHHHHLHDGDDDDDDGSLGSADSSLQRPQAARVTLLDRHQSAERSAGVDGAATKVNVNCKTKPEVERHEWQQQQRPQFSK